MTTGKATINTSEILKSFGLKMEAAITLKEVYAVFNAAYYFDISHVLIQHDDLDYAQIRFTAYGKESEAFKIPKLDEVIVLGRPYPL